MAVTPRLLNTDDLRGGSYDPYPVGSVFTAVVDTNPATLLGYGTWSAIAAGRVLVGVDAGDPDFEVAGLTPGSKTVAAAGSNAAESAHTHSVTSAVDADSEVVDAVGLAATVNALIGPVSNPAVTSGAGASHNHAFTGSATSVVQPSLTVYFWERTA